MTLHRFAAALAALVVAAAPLAAQTKTSVTGSWAMTIDGNGAHGDMKATLTLKQEGDTLTGEFTSPHAANRPVTGEFKDGKLSFAITTADGQTTIGFSAALRDENTLAGYMSTPGGDLQWTATRDQARR